MNSAAKGTFDRRFLDNILTPADEVRLRTEEEITQELNVPLRTFRRLRRRRLVPVVKLGYRLYRYDIVDVRAALNRLKIKAVA
jgi:hypothetical protein